MYFETLINQQVILQSRQVDANFEGHLLENLVRLTEGKCKYEGYVKPGSVQLKERSIGKMLPNKFRGDMLFDVKYRAEVCNPVKGDRIECKVLKKNKMGMMASAGPLVIIIPNQLHANKETLDKIQPEDTVTVSVIGKKYHINDDHIDVVARLATDISKEKPSKAVTKVVTTPNSNANISSAENTDELESEEYEEQDEDQEGGDYEKDLAEMSDSEEEESDDVEREDNSDEEHDEDDTDEDETDDEGDEKESEDETETETDKLTVTLDEPDGDIDDNDLDDVGDIEDDGGDDEGDDE